MNISDPIALLNTLERKVTPDVRHELRGGEAFFQPDHGDRALSGLAFSLSVLVSGREKLLRGIISGLDPDTTDEPVFQKYPDVLADLRTDAHLFDEQNNPIPWPVFGFAGGRLAKVTFKIGRDSTFGMTLPEPYPESSFGDWYETSGTLRAHSAPTSAMSGEHCDVTLCTGIQNSARGVSVSDHSTKGTLFKGWKIQGLYR